MSDLSGKRCRFGLLHDGSCVSLASETARHSVPMSERSAHPRNGMKPSAAMQAAGEARAANAIVTFVTNLTFLRRRLRLFIPAQAGTRFHGRFVFNCHSRRRDDIP